MSHNHFSMTGRAVIAIAGMVAASVCAGQDMTGNWVGTLAKNILPGANDLSIGRGKRVVVNLSKLHSGELTGMIYDGQHSAGSFAFTSVVVVGNHISFTIKPPGGAMSFSGTLSDDENSINGYFQGVALNLERAKRVHTAKAPLEKTAEVTSDADSSAVLARALEKLSGTTRRLLKYTCLETIDRTYYVEPARPAAESCEDRNFSQDGSLRLDAEDRLRLEVAVSGGSEIHSWAAASRFDARSVFQMVSTGPVSTGAFGTLLVDIFENKGAQYSFVGKKAGVYEYAFDVALPASGSFVKDRDAWIKTAYHGTFDIYPATGELARLFSETAPLPATTQMCRNRMITDYHYALIGDSQFLLPSRSVFDTVSPNGNETHSVTTFSACHEFRAESSLVLDEGSTAAAAQAAPKNVAALPAGLSLTLALTAPLDTHSAAAGDAISARVVKAVHAPGSNDVLVPAGAVAHGRILQMRHQFSSSQFIFSIRYDTLELKGAVAPLAIKLDREVKAESSRAKSGLAKRGAEIALPPVESSSESGSWFAVPAAGGGYVMAAGSESKWITVAR